MPSYTTSISLSGAKDSLSIEQTGTYNELISITQIVDDSVSFVPIITGSATKGLSTLNDSKGLIIKNNGISGAEIQIKKFSITNGTPDTIGAITFDIIQLGAGDFIYLPNLRLAAQSADASGGDAYTLSNQVPDSNMYVALNNAAAGDAQLLNGAELASGTTATAVTVDEAAYLFVGDLIRLENEICEIVSISGEVITIIRGSHGSAKATHADDVAIRLPFFNAYADFDKYSTAQTDAAGRFKCTNFIGFGRNTDGSGYRESMGIVAGSVSGKFYEAGYQEFGMSAITGTSTTGLAVNTTYAIDIAADGGSDCTLAFTTHASDRTFATLVTTIQSYLDEQFYTTSSNLLDKKVTVAIVGGDLRFTSGQHLSTSAISITAPASGTTPFGVGAFSMAVGDIEDAVAAKLPSDTILNAKSGVELPNVDNMFYDDGHGVITSGSELEVTGTINYETGAITLEGAPANGNFVLSANYGSGLSGGNKFSSHDANCITSIAGRSMNSKLNTTIEIIGLN